MDAGRTEEMVKLVITAMVEAETGDSEEILERCSSYSINVRILCFFLVHPSIVTSCWGGDSMVYDRGMRHANRCQGRARQRNQLFDTHGARGFRSIIGSNFFLFISKYDICGQICWSWIRIDALYSVHRWTGGSQVRVVIITSLLTPYIRHLQTSQWLYSAYELI